MLKALGWLLGIVVLAVIGIGAYIVLNAGGLAKDAMEEFGPQYLGASVSVDSVDVALADGAAEIRGLAIGNPAGYAGTHAMKVGTIKAVMDPQRTSEQLIVLKRVDIDGADIAAVAQGQRTNFQALLDHLEREVGDDPAANGAGGSEEVKFIVDQLNFTNAKASLTSDVLGEVAMEIPPINLENIGDATGGATGAEVAQQLLKPLSSAISREAVNQGLDIEGVKGRVQDRIRDKIGEGLRGLTDRLKK